MESDSFRLILLIAGVVLIGGIYFWDRLRRAHTRPRAPLSRREHVEPVFGSDPQAQERGPGERSVLAARGEVRAEELRSSGYAGESSAAGELGTAEHGAARDLPADGAEPNPEEFARTDERQMIIHISVSAKGGQPFPGQAVRAAFEQLELQFGLFHLYHRYVRGGKGKQIVFSVANLVEPGVFDPERMDASRFPGLSLFMKLPGPKEDLEAFGEMLSAGRDLAAILGGELKDQNHSTLTRQTIEHLREEIIEHRRRLQLARRHA